MFLIRGGGGEYIIILFIHLKLNVLTEEWHLYVIRVTCYFQARSGLLKRTVVAIVNIPVRLYSFNWFGNFPTGWNTHLPLRRPGGVASSIVITGGRGTRPPPSLHPPPRMNKTCIRCLFLLPLTLDIPERVSARELSEWTSFVVGKGWLLRPRFSALAVGKP